MEILETKTDIGLIRDKNEDATLSIKHPRNKNIKLLVVADGMGGKDYGDVASTYIVSHLNRWFLNKDIKTLNDTQKVEDLLTLNCELIQYKIKDKY